MFRIKISNGFYEIDPYVRFKAWFLGNTVISFETLSTSFSKVKLKNAYTLFEGIVTFMYWYKGKSNLVEMHSVPLTFADKSA